jgi:hypothetical protein
MTRHNRGLKQGTDLAYGKRRVCAEMVSYHHALVAVYRISVIGRPGTLDVVAFRTICYRDQTVCPHCNCFNQMQEFGLYLADALSSDKTLLRYNVSNFLNSATTRTLPLESASPQVRVCMRAAMGLLGTGEETPPRPTRQLVNPSSPKFPPTHSPKTFPHFAGFYPLQAHNGIVIETTSSRKCATRTLNSASAAKSNPLRPLQRSSIHSGL